MDELKPVSIDELKVISGKLGFDLETTIKDYQLTVLLYYLSSIKGVYFKGGTALNKIFLNHLRLSEDLDFTVTESVYKNPHFPPQGEPAYQHMKSLRPIPIRI